MPKRFTIRQRETIYNFIAARDGEQCLVCYAKPKNGEPLDIDHADNNVDNWNPRNLHLICANCNLGFRSFTSEEHQRLILECCALCERERERSRGRVGTSLVKELVDYRKASPEMKANSYYEVQFRDWALVTVREHKTVEKDELINSGAEVVGCSPLTARRYLAKLTSSVGILREHKEAGTVVISFRSEK